jgi:inosine triphosphate pyrophosphatase
MTTLNFISGNQNKLAEVQCILGDEISVHNQAIDIPEIQGTLEEIAREKCRSAAKKVSLCICSSLDNCVCLQILMLSW